MRFDLVPKLEALSSGDMQIWIYKQNFEFGY
jgi:hypothetical protein